MSAACWSSADSPEFTRATSPTRSSSDATRSADTRTDDLIYQPVLHCLLRSHEPVAVDVAHHLVDVALGVPRDDLGHPPRHLEHLARVDVDVGRRAAEARRALV